MHSELDTYRDRIENLRHLVREVIQGLPEEALNWRPIPGEGDHASNSLAVLAAHIAGAQTHWIAEVVGGRPATRIREAEFEVRAGSVDELDAILDRSAQAVNEVFSELTPGDLDGARTVDGFEVSVRWAILHIVDHTALHLGHMQITRQLWDGGKAVPSPFWQQRLPEKK